jgi:exopolysaccharide biosynthesis polyprenyl glycosylphosphotransferase
VETRTRDVHRSANPGTAAVVALPRPAEASLAALPWIARRPSGAVWRKGAVILLDGAAAVTAALIAGRLRPVLARGTGGDGMVTVLAAAVWLGALQRFGLFRARYCQSRSEEARRILRAGAAATTVLVAAAAATGRELTTSWLAVLFLSMAVALFAEREVLRHWFERRRAAGVLVRPVVVVGANAEAAELADLLGEPTHGYRVLGFVTDAEPADIDPSVRRQVVGPLDRTLEIVDRLGAVGVVVASSAVPPTIAGELGRLLTEAGVHVEATNGFREMAPRRLTMGQLGSLPRLYLEPVRRDGWHAGAKRALDVVVAGIGLLVLAPAFLVVAVAVRATSPGPVFFRQVRLGHHGRLFRIVKFRTMVVDAERQRAELLARNEASGPLFKIRDDPRVTPIGRFLRRTSIDELPQLWNVVRGDMSIVGPRPALPAEAAAWEPPLHRRLCVRPGITGLWQVSGRSDASFGEYSRLDLRYVDNWSLPTDLAILARTVPVVLAQRGAR